LALGGTFAFLKAFLEFANGLRELRILLAQLLIFEDQLLIRRRVHANPRQRRITSAVRDYRGFQHPRQDGAKQSQKLGLAHICRSTVVNILREAGIDTAPKRGAGTWDDFVQRHAASLWACDFFTKKVWTLGGPVSFFVLFFIHIGTRRVHVAGTTAHPDRQWMAEQAGQVAHFFAAQTDKPTLLIRDLDSKFTAAFDEAMKSAAVAVVPVGPRAPNLNAFAERFVLSIKSECLDHFIVFGEAHLRYLVDEYMAHYHTERPHQGKDNMPLTGDPPPPRQEHVTAKAVEREHRLGGLLNHYRLAA
jgi:putative transposase